MYKFIILLFISTTLNAQNLCRMDNSNCLLTNLDQRPINKKINVLNQKLQPCSLEPLTGFFRDGTCNSTNDDYGNHSVCAVMTDEFLNYTLNQGNNLISPNPKYNFPGLKAGDKWCLCASRWLEAYQNGIKLKINLNATHQRALIIVSKNKLIEGSK